ncbi:hypothetical protein [Sphingomonas sp.]|uniref:hypothetical protein n=1 Tax=Sphingomonas sp. TaxID=28214 RepID=UPI003B3BE252
MLHQSVVGQPTPAPADVRTYTLEHKPQPDWSLRRGMDWAVRIYGKGHWCVGEGHRSFHASEAAAIGHGTRWVETGRGL